MPVLDPNQILRFGDFELDVAGLRAAPPRASGEARPAADGPPDSSRRASPPARVARGDRRAALGQGRLRGRRHRRQHGDQQDSAGASRFGGGAGVCGNRAGQGLPLRRDGRRGAPAPAVSSDPPPATAVVAPSRRLRLCPRPLLREGRRRLGGTHACLDWRAGLGGCGQRFGVRSSQGWRRAARHAWRSCRSRISTAIPSAGTWPPA